MKRYANAPLQRESYALSGGYRLLLEAVGIAGNGKFQVSYSLTKGKKSIFSGSDFYPSPLRCPVGVHSAADCLALLCHEDSERELSAEQSELVREFNYGFLPLAWAECLGLVEL